MLKACGRSEEWFKDRVARFAEEHYTAEAAREAENARRHF